MGSKEMYHLGVGCVIIFVLFFSLLNTSISNTKGERIRKRITSERVGAEKIR